VFYVYLLASRRHGTLYLGVTNDLASVGGRLLAAAVGEVER
jgi:predicted GIY-YIG superfamily endonuclease